MGKTVEQHVRELEKLVMTSESDEEFEAVLGQYEKRGIDMIMLDADDAKKLKSFFVLSGIADSDYLFEHDSLTFRTRRVRG